MKKRNYMSINLNTFQRIMDSLKPNCLMFCGQVFESVEVNDRLMIETFLTFFFDLMIEKCRLICIQTKVLSIFFLHFKKKKERKKRRKKNSPELKVKKINV